jgi:hypothetical protein
VVLVVGLSFLALFAGLDRGSASAAFNTTPISVELPESDSDRSVPTTSKSKARLTFIEDREADAVKPHQSVESGKPQVTVAGLYDRANGVLWQPLISRPTIEPVLRRTGKQLHIPLKWLSIVGGVVNRSDL